MPLKIVCLYLCRVIHSLFLSSLTIFILNIAYTERKRKSSNLNSTIMQKLELCPKIKLNKSLRLVSFPIFTTIVVVVMFYTQKRATLAAKRLCEKYFHDFPHR